MEQELYSYDRYKCYDIYINYDNNMYYGDIYWNGTCLQDNIKSNTGEGCLGKCEGWIDKEG